MLEKYILKMNFLPNCEACSTTTNFSMQLIFNLFFLLHMPVKIWLNYIDIYNRTWFENVEKCLKLTDT